MIHETDILGEQSDPEAARLELGTAGWAGVDEVLDPGTLDISTGVTQVDVVRVTLFRGHPTGKPASDEGLANGRQIVARLTMPFYVPQKGQQCVVLFPSGLYECHGAAVCLPVGGPTTKKLPNAKDGEVVIPGPAGQLIRMTADGAIWFSISDDASPTGATTYWRLAPGKGQEFSSPHCRDTKGPNGFRTTHSSGASIGGGAVSGLPDPFQALSSYVTLQAATATVTASAVALGTDAGATNLTAITALQTLLDAIGLCIADLVPASGVTAPHQAAVATALTAYNLVAQNIGKVV